MSEAKTEDKVEKAPGIGAVAVQAIRDGKSNEEALEAVRAAHPGAKTSLASINWYRQKLRSDGEDVPTSRELKKQRAGEGDEVSDPLE